MGNNFIENRQKHQQLTISNTKLTIDDFESIDVITPNRLLIGRNNEEAQLVNS